MDAIVKRSKINNIIGTRRDRGRPKKTLIEIINKNLSILNLTKHMIFLSISMAEKIHVADPK